MGALMRSLDWSATPVGPVESWPQSLRTVVSIVLESRFPMYVAWGPEYTQFYNDRFRPILGSTKHPEAMGGATPDTFAEIWSTIGPMFEETRAGNAVSFDDLALSLDRHGFLEECFFTFSYSPIRDESGGVGGVLVTVSETTERVLGERRLRTLRDLAAQSGVAATERAVWRRAAETLGGNRDDLPFVLLYSASGEGRESRRLVGSVGLRAGGDLAPGRLPDDEATFEWPLDSSSGRVVELPPSLDRELEDPPWPESPSRAWVEPVRRAGFQDEPYGYLVAGISPRRVWNEAYRDFLRLAADQLAGAIANSQALEEQRRRAEALAEIDRAKTTFFNNISHEFRTPLTLMLGPLDELLSSEDELEARTLESLRLVERSARRLLGLVNTLLAFARMEAGRAEATFVPTDLAAATSELAGMFASAVENAGLELRVRCDPLPEGAWVDREMWGRVVLNLLSNALKFTREGHIEVELGVAGDCFELRVADTGIGIAEDQIPKLFERFHRVQDPRARTAEGTGIGLALVRDLLQLHGGEIEVDSRLDRGTEFRVRVPRGRSHLPADRIGEPDEESLDLPAIAQPYVQEAGLWAPAAGERSGDVERKPDAAPTTTEVESRRARILVVDDNADMRAYLVRLLEPEWDVATAAHGLDALDRMRERLPDLVLADVMMPGIDGLDLVRAIRTTEEMRLVPVVLLTARTGQESLVAGLGVGADDYLVKPFSADELRARLRVHLERGDLRRRLHEEKRRFATLLMEAPAIFAVTRGPDHVFELSNPLHRELLGNEDPIGRAALEVLPQLERGEAIDVLDRVYDTGEPVQLREFPVPIPDATGMEVERFFDWTALPLRDVDGAVSGLLIFAYEVSAQVHAREKAEEATRTKDDFLAMLGHELRNPLAPITTAIELMKLNDPDALARERRIIERQVRHLTRLVDDLLDISRVASGQIQLRKRPLELVDAVRMAVEMTKPLLEERRHHLRLEFPETSGRVLADEARLAQILANLLSNSAKYTDEGGLIVLTVSDEEDEFRVAVEDNGSGFDTSDADSLFEMFRRFSGDPLRHPGGLGLGLSIVRSLVRLHGGRVTAHSDGVGQGSRFEVYLPKADEEEIAGVVGSLSASSGSVRSRRILLVDDNRDAADVLGELLEAAGHRVAVAYDGIEALEQDAQVDPEVILLDLGLPGMDGLQVAERIRARRQGALPVLVAITGYGQDTDRERTREAGFRHHLVKPIEPRELLSLLEGLDDSPGPETDENG